MKNNEIYKERLEKEWARLCDIINACTLRERYVLLLFSFAIIFLLWNFLFLAPIDKKKQQIITNISALKMQIRDINAQSKAIVLEAAKPASVMRMHQLAVLRKELASLQKSVHEVAKHVSKGEKIPGIIKEILAADPDLSLIRLTNTPTAVHSVNVQGVQSVNAPEEAGELGLTVEFSSGNYFSTLRYLERLEKLGWWFWDELDYQVIEYPSAKIRLKLHTFTRPIGSS